MPKISARTMARNFARFRASISRIDPCSRSNAWRTAVPCTRSATKAEMSAERRRTSRNRFAPPQAMTQATPIIGGTIAATTSVRRALTDAMTASIPAKSTRASTSVTTVEANSWRSASVSLCTREISRPTGFRSKNERG